MRIALFSDIHSNLPALEACLASIDAQKPDAIYCLGDLVGYNVWPNEVIREIRRRAIPAIAGNYDLGIGIKSTDCGCAYTTEAEKEMGAVSISYTNSVIGDEERSYLRALPRHIRVEFPASTGNSTLMLVHGSPRKINEYLFEDREAQSLIRMMEKAEADILCFGHTHKPYHRVLPSGNEAHPKFLHAVNIGSVGKPKDGNPRGCYIILTLPEHINLHEADSIKVEFVRFEYDVDKAAQAISASILPDAYASMLREGR